MRPVVSRAKTATTAAVTLAAAALLVSACSSGKSAAKPAAGSAPPTTPAAQAVGSDLFGQRAKIDIPAGDPSGKLDVKVKVAGHGTKIDANSIVVLNFTGKLWRGAQDLGSSYDQGQGPITETVSEHKMLKGWEQALNGQQAGSRVEVVVPPALGFGANGQKAGNITIGPTDTMVFDLDVVGVYPSPDADVLAGPSLLTDATLPTVSNDFGKTEPKITVPAGKQPPTGGVYKTVVAGKGPAVKSGQSVVVQYEGIVWRTGAKFDSSWGKKMFATSIGTGSVVKGWDEGLVGQTVGSRVLLVIPPDKGYGASGQPDAGIQGTDTMVFVVDILDAG